MIWVLIVLAVLALSVAYLVVDSLYFQHLHPDDFVKYSPMYGLDSKDEGEDE